MDEGLEEEKNVLIFSSPWVRLHLSFHLSYNPLDLCMHLPHDAAEHFFLVKRLSFLSSTISGLHVPFDLFVKVSIL
jgi:hypothetical protein